MNINDQLPRSHSSVNHSTLGAFLAHGVCIVKRVLLTLHFASKPRNQESNPAIDMNGPHAKPHGFVRNKSDGIEPSNKCYIGKADG